MQWSVIRTAVLSSGSTWRLLSALFKNWSVLVHTATYLTGSQSSWTVVGNRRTAGQHGGPRMRPRYTSGDSAFGMNCDSSFVRSCSKCWDYRESLWKFCLWPLNLDLEAGGREVYVKGKDHSLSFDECVLTHIMSLNYSLQRNIFSGKMMQCINYSFLKKLD